MNWNHVALITYGFLLGLILLLIAYVLFIRARHPKKEAAVPETPKLDFQQIDRLVLLHQDVKDDLSNIGDALVAMRNEWLAAQADLQRQIDALNQAQPAGKKSRPAPPRERVDPHEQVQKLARFGMEADLISQKTGLSRGEIDLILRMQGQDGQN